MMGFAGLVQCVVSGSSAALPILPAIAYSRWMHVDGATLRALIEIELTSVSDSRVVAHVHKLLVPPHVVLRPWSYGAPGETFPCWNVLEHPRSNTAIAYSEHGFGPRCPWGLVWLSGDAKTLSMGMDSGWFTTFLDAFVESFAAAGLPIWGVCKIDAQGGRTFLTDEGMSDDAAFQKAEEFRASDPAGKYSIGLVEF